MRYRAANSHHECANSQNPPSRHINATLCSRRAIGVRNGFLPGHSMPVKKYLVTGGTGFIGSGLVRRLVQEGQWVRVLDDNSRGAARKLGNAASAVELVTGDIRDPGAADRSARALDCVFHLSPSSAT